MRAAGGSDGVVFIGGPTASGKTELAIGLAERIGGEIISADSQQVYLGFDIGTAKPTAAQMARVPHHLVSYLDPRTEQADAAGFERRASALIPQIQGRGRVPVIVGGTGLYLRALLFGVVDAPPRNEALRRQLEARALAEGRQALHAELAQRDPATAARVQVNDLLRVVRALEILEGTGRRPSELWASHGFRSPRYRARCWLLIPPREALYRRIDQRTGDMFRGGLLEEVRQLLAGGMAEAPPMHSLGYAQAVRVLEGSLTVEEAIAEASRETRRYAKRQITWFRKEPWWERREELTAEALARAVEDGGSPGSV